MNLIALRSRQFQLYFAGAVAAVNGMWILRIVIGWLSWKITGSASFVGTIAAVSLIPTVIFGPFFGVLVDRSNVLRAAFVTNISMTLCVAALLLLEVNDLLGRTALLAIAFAMGTITAGHHPVRLSLGPRLVKSEYVGSVIALAALNFNLARLLSPALGGVLIDRLGITATTAIILGAFVPNLLVLSRLTPREKRHQAEPERFFQALAGGARYLWQRAELRLVILATAVFSVALRGVLDVLPIFADGVFGHGAIGLGELGSAVGAGALSAALIKAFWMAPASQSKGALSPSNRLVAFAGIGALALLGTTDNWGLALASVAVLGFAGTHLGVGMQAQIQSELPDDMRGRVMSIWIVVGLGGSALGAFGIGLFSDHFGMPLTASIFAIAGAVAVAAIIAANPHKKTEGTGPP